MLPTAKLNELKAAARLTHAARKVGELARYTVDESFGSAADWVIALAESAVQDAREYGLEVGPLQTQVTSLAAKARTVDAARRVANQQKLGQGHSTQLLSVQIGIVDQQHAIDETRQLNVRPTAKDKPMPSVIKQANLREGADVASKTN